MKLNCGNHVFDPSVQPVFPKASEGAERGAIKDSRDLFYALIHIGERYAALPRAYHYLQSNFQQVNEHCAACFSPRYRADSLGQLLAKPGFEQAQELPGAALNDLLLQYAPIYLTELCWMPSLSQTVSCQDLFAVELMAMYLRLTKDGQTIAKTRAAFVGYLLASGIELPAVHTFAFAKQADIVEEVFGFGAVQLALAQFPRVFFPEILGFTLAFCHAPSVLGQFFSVEDKTDAPGFIALREHRRKQELPAIKAVISAYLDAFPGQVDALWQRIQSGFWLHRLFTAHCCQQVAARLQTVLTPRQRMHKLLQGLMSHAVGHHGNIRLGSKTIDEWFQEKPFKSENFLATLLHSPLVDKAKPESSKLLKLFEFNGPMFGVLDDKGKAIVKNWLLSELNPDRAPRKKSQIGTLKSRSYAYGLKKIQNEPGWIKVSFEPEQQNNVTEQTDFSKPTTQELYYYLVNSDRYPGVLNPAKKAVESVLARARLFSRMPFSHYSHEAFESYIKALYQHEVDRYKPLNHRPKLSKTAYAWGIEQLAPTILTDGSWLQCVHQLAFYPAHPVGELLGRIYQDEIGNGKLEQNHPHIYQELLDSLGIKLPPIDSRDFIVHPGFIKGAFDIPVYLMAIAKFPATFLPELLGLNMAIELSGLGNQYLRLSQALRYWGINSAIVDIHTSIDNLSSGHSALAMRAIQLYLDDIAANSGTAAVDGYWRRIYTGFCSLQSVSNRFKFSLLWQYFLKKPTAHNFYNKAQ